MCSVSGRHSSRLIPILKRSQSSDNSSSQENGGRKETEGGKAGANTAVDIPDDIYLDYCTPDDEPETMPKRKIRLQKIERRWAKEWKEYRFVTPKYAKKFALKPPGKRAPLEDHQVAHPSSLMTLDDYPEEKERHLTKLKKQAETAVKKFHESSSAASGAAHSSAAETSGPKPKSVPAKAKASKPQEKFAHASVTKPSAPKPSVPKPSTPKPSAPIASTPKSSAPPPKPVQKKVVKTTTASSSSSLPAATSSETKSSTPHVKTLATTEPAPLPSPSKIITVRAPRK
ncbi:hypothetical protein ZWY2020_032546 [Hordeum vulgare]|nr:hypothetical protein ZWY2020_032546 [Hordeum vulgare]